MFATSKQTQCAHTNSLRIPTVMVVPGYALASLMPNATYFGRPVSYLELLFFCVVSMYTNILFRLYTLCCACLCTLTSSLGFTLYVVHVYVH